MLKIYERDFGLSFYCGLVIEGLRRLFFEFWVGVFSSLFLVGSSFV